MLKETDFPVGIYKHYLGDYIYIYLSSEDLKYILSEPRQENVK